MSPPSEHTLFVTGANGFVPGPIVKLALERGYRVRGAVRSETSAVWLRAAFPEYSSQLLITLVPDITKVESYNNALDSTITGVIHTASPFVLNNLKDMPTELLDPAIQGAVTILEATKMYAKSARRVITTASFASNLDMLKGMRPGYTYTESDWNPMTCRSIRSFPCCSVLCKQSVGGARTVGL